MQESYAWDATIYIDYDIYFPGTRSISVALGRLSARLRGISHIYPTERAHALIMV